jgi:hypothetical protein
VSIPWKTWDRMQDALLDFRCNPSASNNQRLVEFEILAGWPWRADAEQLAQWTDICNRTRAEYEAACAERTVIHG